MESWEMETKEYRLGELAKFSNGINFDKDAYFGNGIRLITVSDFGNNFSPAYESLNRSFKWSRKRKRFDFKKWYLICSF